MVSGSGADSRGDRRLADLLELTRHYGDSLGSYRRAFKQLKGKLPPLEFYVHQDWPIDQPLPLGSPARTAAEGNVKKHLAESREAVGT